MWATIDAMPGVGLVLLIALFGGAALGAFAMALFVAGREK